MGCRQTWMALLIPALALGLGVSAAAPQGPEGKAIKGVDVYAVSDTNLVPGSRAAVRVVVKAVTGLVDSKPLPMARVRVTLASDKHPAERLFDGRADVLGNLQADFQVPDWPDGSYKMTVSVRSPVGEGEVSQTVQLKRTGRVLLVTDKPIYQPGQQIQLRALALQAQGLAPMASEALRFEILDPKGNKVFKRELKTGAYGVASVRFQLADEVNQGPYQIEVNPVRKGAAETASKTVVVKKYVLPKFKVGLTTERDYYLPKQTVKGSIQADYFFGKPVAGGEVEIKASTFDVAFKEFATLRGRTDDKGAWEFELKLPDYFVGQPLQKGDAVVKLEAKVVDTAKHPQKAIKSVPVAADPIRLDAVPEAGRLVPGVDNRVFVVATYPDGSPARAEVVATRDGEQIGKVRTDKSGLGSIHFTPDEAQLSPASPRRPAGIRGGRIIDPGQASGRALAISFSARDKSGRSCKVDKRFSTAPADGSILLRTDKAIYRAGDVLEATVLSPSSGACYLDLIKNRQTLMTKSLVLDGGRGQLKLPLSPDAFGSLELHAYRIAADGEIIRDARVLYVHPPRQLEVTVARDKPVYRPGEQAKIRFQVADRSGKPRPAALGVIIVDEAVYALQELQPGLEKVYFTLEKELAKPKAQIEFGPSTSMASLIQADQVEARRQRVAKVLLAKAEPAATPGLWVNPLAERKQKAQQDRYAITNALAQYGRDHALGRRNKAGRWVYRSGLVAALKQAKALPEKHYLDPLGAPYTMRAVEALWPELRAGQYLGAMELNRLWQLRNLIYSELHRRTNGFSPKKVAGLARHLEQAYTAIVRKQPEAAKDLAGKTYVWRRLRRRPGFRQQDFAANIHAGRVQNIYYALSRYGQESQRWYRVNVLDAKTNSYDLPADVLGRVVKRGLLNATNARDIWGHRFRLRKRKKPREQVSYDHRLRFYVVYSVGPDGKAGTKDDLVYDRPWQDGGYRALAEALGVDPNQAFGGIGIGDGALLGALGTRGRGGGGFGLGKMRRGGARFKAAAVAGGAPVAEMARAPVPKAQARTSSLATGKGPAAPKKRKVRVRNYFPETLLFEPALITDEKGQAELELKVADSITTWRMTAMANGRDGGLGSTSHGIRVFQDFFVDLDLPVALTQNDEVSVPVVVYNYLKGPQRVRLELTAGEWFDLQGPAVQEIQLAPNEVQATYYRLKVRGLGKRTLQVRADGSSMSDAIRRTIQVLPDGKEFNQVANGRLEGTIEQTVRIPDDAVAGASKILVRLYPGVFSQVIEGMESMLRLPGG